ncbi:FtsX-like permease family protein [Cryptosporangium arvum]|uniref:Putative permease n=1 Tax=Cryptosporangium arvum DSM 44712 TaxID=927661 RepID=A0A011AC52_9ACTN|nr:FtsX-like permease family protein [Cryptosporangium arvum]EXG79616.1 putative permease [Cryptosporangium arvum DSM 44712]
MRLPVLLRLAVTGGRLDGLRIALTAFGAVLATLLLLSAATVLAIEGDADYTNGLLAEPGLRPGVVTALMLLGIPVLFFVGQCVRVGAPARDRRLAEYRMAGATPGQAIKLAATETGVSAAVGMVIGFAVFLLGRVVLDRSDPPRPLPTDVLPSWWALLLIALVVPLGGAALAALALRRSTLSAFGVVRNRPVKAPRIAPAVMFFGGGTALVSLVYLDRFVNEGISGLVGLLVFLLLIVTLLGLVLGGAALSAWIGGRVASRAKSPALLLAGRRLVADPWAASRTLPTVFAAVVIGAGALTMRAGWAADRAAQARLYPSDSGAENPFYDRAFALTQLAVWVAVVVAAGGLLVATAEQILERRRTLAALTAQGTPTGVLARALLWQTALPLIPGVVLATAVGAITARVVASPVSSYSQEDATGRMVEVHLENLTPWLGLVVLVVGTVLVTMLVCALGLLLLRRATAVDELRTT